MTHKGEPYIRRDWLAYKKAIYERRMAGESYEDIGHSLGIATATAIMHARSWRTALRGAIWGRTRNETLQIVAELTATSAPARSQEYGYA